MTTSYLLSGCPSSPCSLPAPILVPDVALQASKRRRACLNVVMQLSLVPSLAVLSLWYEIVAQPDALLYTLLPFTSIPLCPAHSCPPRLNICIISTSFLLSDLPHSLLLAYASAPPPRCAPHTRNWLHITRLDFAVWYSALRSPSSNPIFITFPLRPSPS